MTLTNEQIRHDNEIKAFATGIYSGNENFIPSNSVKILQTNSLNGFYAEAFIFKSEIIIAIRGTEILKPNDLLNDIKMATGKKPRQYDDAIKFYKEVLKYCKENNINKTEYEIVFTGHSLGGSLTQLLSYATGHLGITFNAFGVLDIAPEVSILKGLARVRNYGNINDGIFYVNINKHIGDIYILDTNPQETRPKLPQYHFIKNFGDLKDAHEYDPTIHKKFGNYTIRMLIKDYSDDLQKNIAENKRKYQQYKNKRAEIL